VEDFVANVEKHRPDILGMSALLTTTMPEMKKVIDLLVDRGLRNQVKVMVGGAPVNEKFAADIGADGYGADAGSSVDLARALLQKKESRTPSRIKYKSGNILVTFKSVYMVTIEPMRSGYRSGLRFRVCSSSTPATLIGSSV
jgi:cobalamin-dependent methionine synthase I